MRPPRMTTRQWMIAVAVVGIVLAGVERMFRQSDLYRQRAYHHAIMEATDGGRYCSLFIFFDDEVCPFKLPAGTPAGTDGLLGHDARADARQLYHHRMYHKWLRAASRPWLPIEPDPREPD